MIRDHSGGWSQANTRRFQRMTDQHGRKWGATIENKSGEPCGAIMPEFDAPFLPPQKYLAMVAEEPSKLRIAYEDWLSDLRAAHEDYHKQALDTITAHQWPIPAEGEPYAINVVRIIGSEPQAMEPVVAAFQGNPYVLGLTTRVDVRLAGYFAKRDTGLPALAEFPDYSELEEAVDPEALGGSRERLSRGPKGAERRGRAEVGT